MKTRDNALFAAILAILVFANAALDYVAFAEVVCDVDAFSYEMGFGNLTAGFMALGTSLILIGLPYQAAAAYMSRKAAQWIPMLLGCGAIAAIIAGLRLAGLTGGVNASISGQGAIGLDIESVVSVCIMFAMCAGESVLAFFNKINSYKREAESLKAALVRIEANLAAIDAQISSAARIANERMMEATQSCKRANEHVLQTMLGMSGDMQNVFIGYVTEGEKARADRISAMDETVGGLLIRVATDGAVTEEAKDSSATDARRQKPYVRTAAA